MRETFAVLVGTLVSQTTLNILALGMLGAIIVSTTDLFQSSTQKLFLVSFAPLLLLVAVLLAPMLLRANGRGRAARVVDAIRRALFQVRTGLSVFRSPRRGIFAAAAQLSGWALQLLACWALFAALGLDHRVGIGAAARTRSPTASSCRRWRSRPPARSGCRRWCGRGSPGRTCASARSRPRRCASPRVRPTAIGRTGA